MKNGKRRQIKSSKKCSGWKKFLRRVELIKNSRMLWPGGWLIVRWGPIKSAKLQIWPRKIEKFQVRNRLKMDQSQVFNRTKNKFKSQNRNFQNLKFHKLSKQKLSPQNRKPKSPPTKSPNKAQNSSNRHDLNWPKPHHLQKNHKISSISTTKV